MHTKARLAACMPHRNRNKIRARIDATVGVHASIAKNVLRTLLDAASERPGAFRECPRAPGDPPSMSRECPGNTLGHLRSLPGTTFGRFVQRLPTIVAVFVCFYCARASVERKKPQHAFRLVKMHTKARWAACMPHRNRNNKPYENRSDSGCAHKHR